MRIAGGSPVSNSEDARITRRAFAPVLSEGHDVLRFDDPSACADRRWGEALPDGFPDMDIPERYVHLCLRVGRHVDDSINACIGPSA